MDYRGVENFETMGPAAESNVDLNEVLKKREALKKIIFLSIGIIGTASLGVGAYLLYKRSNALKLVSKVVIASTLPELVTSTARPLFLKVPEFMTERITASAGTKATELLDFLKVVQYDKSFSDRRNLIQSSELLGNIYDRMDNLIALQASPDFNPRAMRSLERVIFMLCKKSLSHQSVCRNLETKQLINGLMLALDRHSSKT